MPFHFIGKKTRQGNIEDRNKEEEKEEEKLEERRGKLEKGGIINQTNSFSSSINS